MLNLSAPELEPNKGKEKKHKEGKKKHITDEILGLSEAPELEPNKGKEKKHKEGKKKHVTDEILGLSEAPELEPSKGKKNKHKEGKKKHKTDEILSLSEAPELEPNKGKKMKDKEGKKKHRTDEILDLSEGLDENYSVEAAERQTCCIEGKEESYLNKRKKKKVRKDIEVINSNLGGDKEMQLLDDNQQSKTKKRKDCDDSLARMQEMGASKPSKKVKVKGDNELKSNEGDPLLVKNNEGEIDDQDKKMKMMMKKKKKKLSEKIKPKENKEFEINEGEDDDQGKKIKKKEHSGKMKSKESNDSNEHYIATEVDDQGRKMKEKKKRKANTTESPNPASGETSKPKRVTFSDEVVVCSDDALVRGKRFTPEEDEIIEEAVLSYIKSHDLGDEGLDMVLHCKSHREVKGCWKEIAAALPHRPTSSVYFRAHILFERDEKRKWTPEELDFVIKAQEQYGSDWRSVADALGKNRLHVKDAWRRIRLANARKGHWSQEEYQKLFDLVNLDLRVRASEEYKQSKHGMLRDNISWEAISTKLETRTMVGCCQKWYEQITSPMVADNIWSDTDDYRLINALFTLDACCFEEVEWDNLLEHRPGDVCRKRWNEMLRQIGEYAGKSFSEKVEILAKRYCPDLVEVREAFDNKPVVG
ncbi:hypothetical protein RIF29_30537 [Crotalaria pallida]|uniref:Uncharacterized protein n=1 Tax=Crotalaria pallida TaxID=3830 RepID=A0AAN9I1A7_CROPI